MQMARWAVFSGEIQDAARCSAWMGNQSAARDGKFKRHWPLSLGGTVALSVVSGVVWAIGGLAIYLGYFFDPPSGEVRLPPIARLAHWVFAFPSESILPPEWMAAKFGELFTARQEVGGFFCNGVIWALVFLTLIYLWRWEGARQERKE